MDSKHTEYMYICKHVIHCVCGLLAYHLGNATHTTADTFHYHQPRHCAVLTVYQVPTTLFSPAKFPYFSHQLAYFPRVYSNINRYGTGS